MNKVKDIIFAREVNTCINVAEKFPKNYYAWTHRRYLWELFSFESSRTDNEVAEKKEGRYEQRQRSIQLLETELMIRMWKECLEIHPADHSAVHYSCQVLDLLLTEIISFQLDSDQSLMDDKIESISFLALDQVRILLSKFSQENESLWILRRVTYKILWKHLYYPSVAKKFPDKEHFFNTMVSLVCRLLRNDLKSIVSSTLNSDIEDHQVDSQNYDENESSNNPTPKSIHAWTFLAWCIVNLNEIDDHREGATNDVIFTPRVREIASEYLTSTTGILQHNHLVYTSSSSPITTMLVTGSTWI